MKTMTAIELIADTLRTGIVECGDFNCYDCPFGADREFTCATPGMTRTHAGKG